MKQLWRRIRLLEFKNDISLVKMDFYAVIIPTVLSTKMFKRNIDLKKLIDSLILANPIKDYLYGNRTALLARLLREIENNDELILKKNIAIFKEEVIGLMESNGLVEPSDVTKFINKYSRIKEAFDD